MGGTQTVPIDIEGNQRKSSVDFQEFVSFNASDGGLLLFQRP